MRYVELNIEEENMNPWTLSLLLLVTVCCSILVEVTSGLENDDAEKNVDFLRDNKAIREYIRNADNKAKAVEDIREKLLAAGMKARARRFMKRARTRFEKRRENRKEHHGRKDLPRRRGEYGRGYGGRRGGYGRGYGRG